MVAADTAAKACSFDGATVVLMADGTKKAIEDVEVGDKVTATDPETGEQEAKTVEHVWVHDDTVTDLVVDGEVITTTSPDTRQTRASGTPSTSEMPECGST